MARSLEQQVADPTYLEFFGLTQPPFAPLADSSQLFLSEQYSLLMEHLTNAVSNTDSLVVICGADGCGKSTLLNRFINKAGDHISCVVIDETCHGEEQFYSALLTQIGFEEISGTASELRNITKEFLVCRGIAKDHVLIVIDNAHLTDPMILEQLRWLCNIKIKDRRVLSVVLAGNADIVRVVDAPAMRQTKFRSHAVFSIRNYSDEETANYVWHRLALAGGNDGVKLQNEAILLIHRYSGGVPNVINRLCDEVLAQAYKLGSRVITEKVVRTVVNKLRLLPHVIPPHGQGRRKSDPDFKHVRAVPETAGSGSEDLQQQIARHAEQLDDLRADKARALQEIDARNNDIIALRDALASQTIEVEKLKRSRAIDVDEIAQQNLALSDRATAVQEIEKVSDRIAADLEKETLAREAAEEELAKAVAAVEVLDSVQDELRSVHDMLALRDEALAELETRLEESQAESESAQLRIAALKNPEELEEVEKASDRLAADLRKEKRARKAAEKELAKATATAEELTQLKRELQTTHDVIQGKTGELDSLQDELKLLQDRLASRDKDVADIESWLEESQAERAMALERASGLKSPEELEEVESASAELAAKLEQEIVAREAAEKELAKATTTAEELSQLESELRATVRDLNVDLTVAGERAVDAYVLERNVTDLKDQLEKITRELDSRDRSLADLEKQLEASQNECNLLRRRASASKHGEGFTSEKESSTSDTGGYSSLVVARFEQSLQKVPAYQTLQELEPAFYESLIAKSKKLIGLDHTDKQVKDAMRAEQAKLIEKLLPGASDEAIISYARLAMDQLDAFQSGGIEPCFTLLIPPGDPGISSPPAYSQKTKNREFDSLDITLRTHDSDRQIPTEKDVWPDLGPIFAELFEDFGADNVAAMENSYDPSVDRVLVCSVTRALYSGVLDLPKRNAANALRWLLSTE